MTKSWTILLLFLTVSVYAEEPRNFCNGNSCSQREQEIWDGFEANQLSQPQDLSPQVYSGECYHTGYGYDNTDTHYGVGYLAPSATDPKHIYFSGQFGFFYPSDPYADITTASAPEKFPDHGNRANSVVYMDGRSGEVDFSPSDQIWMYWLRPSADLKTLYVVALWTGGHAVYCEWKRHD